MAVATLAELFLHAAGHQKPDALLTKVAGAYRPISTAELVDRVRRLARGMERRGLAPGDRVALMAENGPHWPVIDFATLASGAATVPVYPTLLPEQAAHIVRDSTSKIVFVQGAERLRDLLATAGGLAGVELLVLVDTAGPGDAPASDDPRVTTLTELLDEGADFDPEAFGDRAHRVEPDDLATLVYTSGTTGEPKGVMLTHRNLVSNIEAALSLFEIRKDHQALCFLPLAHAYERTIDYCYFYRGASIAYAESIQTLGENMGEVKPHLFVSVPRVYEKVLARIQENVARSSPVKQKIFRWAEGVAQQALPHRLRHQSPPGLLGVKLALADRLVFGKIRERLGGRFEFAFSGGAPLAPEIAEFFWGAGVEIYEGYGLTETSPVIAVNTREAVRLGTVGRPIPGVEVVIAEDGEILSRGPNTMAGYWGKEEATAEVIDEEGFFHTGDIGEIDGDGFLTITDRKKELIVNAYGKNVAPAPIENALKTSRFISQAVIIGDRRKFLSALLVPDFEALDAWGESEGLNLGDPAATVEDRRVRELFGREVAETNAKLAHYEQIVSWALLPEEFSIESGELTPTQKVKRRVVDENHAETIDRLYREAERTG